MTGCSVRSRPALKAGQDTRDNPSSTGDQQYDEQEFEQAGGEVLGG